MIHASYLKITQKYFSIVLFGAVLFFGLFLGDSVSAEVAGRCFCTVRIHSTNYIEPEYETVIEAAEAQRSLGYCEENRGADATYSFVTEMTRHGFENFILSTLKNSDNAKCNINWYTVLEKNWPTPDPGGLFVHVDTRLHDWSEQGDVYLNQDKCESFNPIIEAVLLTDSSGSTDITGQGITNTLSCKFEAVQTEQPEQPEQPKEEGCGPLGCTAGAAFKDLNKLKLSGEDAIPNLIGRIIKAGMQVIGSIALIIFVAGGLMWMTARGNSERISTALKMITWATLGIIVILSSYMLVEFVFGIFK